ncbi:hypothetical protein BBO99_00007872 [Phytophthora kernoviae]|uniref:LYC1 C-terminal domain-containing protein n=2 Tax=Phytophthora kernoviae TaxID=325452 RepID=A0A3R7GUW9_9STRA|nr:hypothetical protein G195_009032 [Phytophthora kernoviae 00238/432]KAG2508801.1 hypothetical protein JM16_008700 [Phytophthora kernoviae]KAG2517397.1 hypothetical protein JM18_007199 [Phytophthora kernoviae]RLN14096.1 hypothetical protein BBI17_007812 [Phytophthora kernoviae]RLN76033.1 hypothetical protein BBO99_00007872 [Phytophthora kernoviae]
MDKFRVVRLTQEALKVQCKNDDFEEWGAPTLNLFQYQLFTLPEFRKRGLATFFMKEVAKQLAQLPGALVSVLYSDIGPTYYDKLGWNLHPSQMATLDVMHPRNAKTDDSTELISLMLDDELDTFLKIDNDRLVQELSSAKFEGRKAFVVLPTCDSLEWQFCIGVHFARVRGLDELPSCCGVKINEDTFVVWCHNVKESTLYIVRARFPDVGNDAAVITCALMNAALEEARKFQLKKVAIWNPPPSLLHDDVRRHLEIEFVERGDSLSSAMVFHNGGVDVDGDAKTLLPHWLGNEKYAWV